MSTNLVGPWQLSPLTDLAIPQSDISLPAPLSSGLPQSLTEENIGNQEWHLMHNFWLEPNEYNSSMVRLNVAGIDQYAEVRVNGVAVMDCHSSFGFQSKDITAHVLEGGNRIEILFLELDEDDWLLMPDDNKQLNSKGFQSSISRKVGIWQAPQLQFISHVLLEQVTTEQVWHEVGGCELIVNLDYQVLRPGLVSASVSVDGMTLHIPIDCRKQSASAVFQIEAPAVQPLSTAETEAHYQLKVILDGQQYESGVVLNNEISLAHD